MIKKIVSLTLLVLIGKFGTAQEVNFNTGSWKAARELAAKTHKAIFVDLYFEGCMPCKQMDLTTFVNPEVVKYMTENYICYKTDVMKEEDGKELSVRYGASGFPTYVMLSEDGHVVDITSGYSGVKNFMPMVTDAKKNADQHKYKNFSVDKPLTQYPPMLYNRYFNKEAKTDAAAINGYLDQLKDPMGENHFLTMTSFPASEQHNKFFFEHATELADKYSRVMVRNRLLGILKTKGNAFAANNDLTGFRKTLAQVQPVFANDWPRFEKILMEGYFMVSQDYQAMVDYVQENGNYDLVDRITLTNQLIAKNKGAKELSALQGFYSKTDNSFENYYMLGLLNWFGNDKTAAKDFLGKALQAGPKNPKEEENVQAFIQHIDAPDANFKPSLLARSKPISLE